MASGKRKHRPAPAPPPESAPPIVQCVGCAQEGKRRWGLHLFVVDGHGLPFCFHHLQLGRDDLAKAERGQAIADLFPVPELSPLRALEVALGLPDGLQPWANSL